MTRFPHLVLLLLVLCLAGPGQAQSGRTVLVNAQIHTALEEPFWGFLAMQDGEIVEIGRGQPTESRGEHLDLAGGHLYPGLIDADCQLGLVEVEALRATRDEREVGSINPNLRAALGFRAESPGVTVARSQGVLLCGVNPTGGLISGQGAVMRLWGWTWEEAAVRPDWAMALDWPSMVLPDSLPMEAEKKAVESLEKQLFELDEALAEARAYQPGRRDIKWEALAPFAGGERPLLVRAEGRSEIAAALAWAKKERLRLVLVSGREVHHFAAQLAAQKVPVIYSSLNSPSLRPEEPVDQYYRTPALLTQAGVQVALSPSGLAFDVRELRDLAGKAAAHGLTRLQALQAVTLIPAQILGVEQRVGSLEVGKEATLVATDGDLLEATPRVLRAWGAGRELSLDDRQKQLYRLYRERPRRLP